MVEIVADQIVAPDSATKIGPAQGAEDCLGASGTLSVVNLDNQDLDPRQPGFRVGVEDFFFTAFDVNLENVDSLDVPL